MGVMINVICDFMCVCLWVYVNSLNKKTTWAISTKLGTHILYGRISAYIEPEVKGQGHWVDMKCAAGVGLRVDTTA